MCNHESAVIQARHTLVTGDEQSPGELHNHGVVTAKAALTIESSVIKDPGEISSRGDLTIRLINQQPLGVQSALRVLDCLHITAPGALSNSNRWEAAGALTVEASALSNEKAALICADGMLVLRLGETEALGLTNQGTLQGAAAEIAGYRLDNQAHGIINAKGDITLTQHTIFLFRLKPSAASLLACKILPPPGSPG